MSLGLTAALAVAVRFGDLQRFDDSLEEWVNQHRERLYPFARIASLLGERTVHPLLATASAVTLTLATHQPFLHFAIPLGAASLGGIVAHHVVKFVYRRARPRVALDRQKYEPAFPSGHTTNSTAVLATGAYLFTHEALLAGGVAALIVAIPLLCTGVSRVALGWHWGSDVIGGWLTGLGVAALCASLFLALP